MRFYVRVSLLALVCAALLGVIASAAQAEVGIENFFAANCKVNTCEHELGETPEEELENAEKEGFTQAAGHPNFGITDFKVNTVGTFPNAAPEGAAEGAFVNHVRTDVAPGVATNPESPEKCSFEEFGEEFEPAPGVHTGLFEEPECESGALLGENKVVVWLGPEPSPKGGDLPLTGNVYNLVQPKGLSSDFGVALPLPKALTEALLGIPTPQLYAHTLIEGNVEWGKQKAGLEKGDYHDYFEIKVSTSLPLISSRLVFNGRAGEGDFLTNPTSCTGIGPQTTTTLTLKFEGGKSERKGYSTPIGTAGCTSLVEPVPFAPTLEVSPETKQSDRPDGITVNAKLPKHKKATEIESSQLKTATVTLPEGMTLNPSAAAGKTACTAAQAHIHIEAFGIGCPESSKVGSVTLNVPGLPSGSLTGNLYLGTSTTEPESGTIKGPPFTMYVNAQSERYGVDVRLKATVSLNEATGKVTTTFEENPEQPFTEAIMRFETGALAPIANPLVCGAASTSASFAPYTGTATQSPFVAPFTVDSNNAGGSCASPIPFNVTQATNNQTSAPGADTSFTIELAREDGQQYISKMSTTLPAGLDGKIPNATQCAEPGANKGECPSTSQIGTAVVYAGSGSNPFQFKGPIYLTGPYKGAPFGLSIAVPAVAGPFNFGEVITRATISIDPSTARVTTTTDPLTRILKGVPLRIKRILATINKQGFLSNPTNCNLMATESTLLGFTPGQAAEATFNVSTPFQVANCSALGFTPKFIARTSGKPTKANGASIETTLNYVPGQANTKSVLVQLPKQLPSRLTTLQKACLAANFATNPYSCPPGSFVGGARANTPLLPGKLTGPAILVSHAGAAFPDLDLVLEANGVRIILVGNTNIKKGITTTNFATTPDAPVSSVTVNLPMGPHSALAANGNLCAPSLYMPTTITAQNGKQFKQKTLIQPLNCGVQILKHKVSGNTAILTVKTFAAGRISGSGAALVTKYRKLKGANGAATIKVPLANGGHSRPYKVKVRVGFVPSKKGAHSIAYTTVTFP
jgi:hypothetical protein